METKLILWSPDEVRRRHAQILEIMNRRAIDALLVCSNVNLYYLTGRVFAGFVLLTSDGRVAYFVKRPVEMVGENVHEIRKPEQIPALVNIAPTCLGLEWSASYSTVERLKALWPEAEVADGSGVLMAARSIKTDEEIALIAHSGKAHDAVYRRIPGLYRQGMTDIELQIEIERVMRLEGCLGQMRVGGETMEIHMGNLLVGDNADTPSPYDFTMGGAGLDPSMPVGADGSLIKPGQTVMADMNGNFDGYMTDMTRVFALGHIPDEALRAHECSIAICREIEQMGRPGVQAKALYDKAVAMATEAGLERYFMGHRQHASFVGHGVGIEINELPVLSGRSRDILAENNVIALEPKFVIPHVGAVGIENTYRVTADGLSALTNAPEEIIYFE